MPVKCVIKQSIIAGPSILLVLSIIVYFLHSQLDGPNWLKYIDPFVALITTGVILFCSAPAAKKSSAILFQMLPGIKNIIRAEAHLL